MARKSRHASPWRLRKAATSSRFQEMLLQLQNQPLLPGIYTSSRSTMRGTPQRAPLNPPATFNRQRPRYTLYGCISIPNQSLIQGLEGYENSSQCIIRVHMMSSIIPVVLSTSWSVMFGKCKWVTHCFPAHHPLSSYWLSSPLNDYLVRKALIISLLKSVRSQAYTFLYPYRPS